jgi:hypothetical protein
MLDLPLAGYVAAIIEADKGQGHLARKYIS